MAIPAILTFFVALPLVLMIAGGALGSFGGALAMVMATGIGLGVLLGLFSMMKQIDGEA